MDRKVRKPRQPPRCGTRSINPWLKLPASPPFVLESDASQIKSFNARVGENLRIELDLLPEPFLGNPDAPVVLLNLNPGFSDGDIFAHRDTQFRDAVLASLRHARHAYPFFYLDPKGEYPGHRWWQRRLKPLLEHVPPRQLASRLLCVEFFPYHARQFRHGKLQIPSQSYSFELVKIAMLRKAIIVLLRGQKPWLQAVPSLASYPRLYRLNSPQNVTMSQRNCPDGFRPVLKALST